MDDFETAIMLSLDPTVSGEVKEKANRYCDSVRTTPDAWKFCVEKIYKTSTMQVKFFCFQILQDLVLHGYAALSESDRTNLKMFLLNWMRDCSSIKQEDYPVKNKYAQLMALLMKTEYPDQWPTFFRDLLNLLNGAGPPVVDLFLRVIKAVDEEVVSHELVRSTADIAHTAHIKDAMREGAVGDLVHVWYELLSIHKTSPPALVNMCLETLRGYVGWIDIGLVVNEKFMTLLFQLLAIRTFSEEVVECLYEIVCKGMEPHAKFNLLKQLNIKSIIAVAASDDTQYMTKVGKLTNTMGVELIACMDAVSNPPANGAATNGVTSQAEVESMLAEMLALLFKTMNNESDEVAASVLGFAGAYVNRLKSTKVNSTQVEHLEVFLQIIRNKAKYPTSFNFDDQDEEEKEFTDFRRELTTIYRNILRIIPERSIEFVRLTLTAVSITPPAPFPDAEIALQLFYQIGEVLPSAQDPGTAKLTEQFFTQTMVSLSTGPLSSHPHQSVALTFFDCAVRYAKYIPAPSSQPQFVVAILTAFLDARGLRHPSLAMRKRVAISFSKFVRALRAALYPFLDSIVTSLQELLVISFEVQKNVPFDDQVNFYESLGVLIGSNPDMGMQQKHTEALMQPVLAQLEEILAKELYKTDIASGKPYYTTLLSQVITVVTIFSKGFVAAPKEGSGRSASPSRSPNGKAQHDHISSSPPRATHTPSTPAAPPTPTPLAPSRLGFVKSLELVLRVPVVLPTNDDLRDKVYTFLHRMVEVLGPNIYPVLPSALALLLSHTYRIKDIQEFITLTNQVTSRFRETVFGLLNDMLMPFVRRMFEMLNPASAPTEKSEEQREMQELQKSYYVFLQCTLNNNLASVFTSTTNAPHFQQILNTVVQGCTSKDLATQKVCVAILRRMVEEWGGVPTFTNLIFEQIVPRLFEMAMAPSFDIGDAVTNALAGEIAKVLKLVHTKTGPPFITFLAQVYLPSIQCPTEAAQQFVQHLDKTPIKQFTDVFKEFTRVSKVANLRTS